MRTRWTLLLMLALVPLLMGSQSDPDVYTTTAPGATFVPNVENALKAVQSANSGDTEPTYKVRGTWWYETDTDLLQLYDGDAWIPVIRIGETASVAAPIQGEVAFADADATPSVTGITSAKTANTGATTITGFDDGTAGQILTLRIADGNTTIASGLTATGMTIPGVAGDTLQWVYDGSAWKQIGGSVGMGRYVPLADEDAIADWIAITQTAWTDVDVSDDGVRQGACAVKMTFTLNTAGAACAVLTRRNGSSSGGSGWCRVEVGGTMRGHGEAKLDDNAVFEAAMSANGVSGTSTAAVIGYWI